MFPKRIELNPWNVSVVMESRGSDLIQSYSSVTCGTAAAAAAITVDILRIEMSLPWLLTSTSLLVIVGGISVAKNVIQDDDGLVLVHRLLDRVPLIDG